ncbi:hypothetical protein BUALT_Bualt05G0079100 [Buddleja alternifolia]|uniref:Protein kinase domain-containing protein n=1 Tax=Buddleja alternifolia TaxID=168488 RepID=A0AAV6XPG3_9LAMI|nr:hypothetical protein BUALT_Bualt05G0079100 [Buddleja alternifolia]
MMKCFYIFKSSSSRSRSRRRPGKSAPELRKPEEESNNSNRRACKSTGSMPSPRRSIPEMYREKGQHHLREFSLSQLREATNNFNRLLKIGEGGFGSVYKGSINIQHSQHPTIVAIKKLNTQGLQPVGTRGYAAPEYVETGHLTVKSDIWSFGVVLYEILTGRRTLERNLPSAEQKLLEWVKQFPADSKRFSMIIDQRLQNQYSLSAARRIAKLADSCLNKNPKDRPAMTQVVEILKQAMEESQGTSSQATKSSSLGTNPAMAPIKPFRQIPHMAQASGSRLNVKDNGGNLVVKISS